MAPVLSQPNGPRLSWLTACRLGCSRGEGAFDQEGDHEGGQAGRGTAKQQPLVGTNVFKN
jgi:hypothetical protein